MRFTIFDANTIRGGAVAKNRRVVAITITIVLTLLGAAVMYACSEDWSAGLYSHALLLLITLLIVGIAVIFKQPTT
jgi:hypothetical protein